MDNEIVNNFDRLICHLIMADSGRALKRAKTGEAEGEEVSLFKVRFVK